MEHNEKIAEIASAVEAVSEVGNRYFGGRLFMVPDRDKVIRLLELMQSAMLPDYFKCGFQPKRAIAEAFDILKAQLTAAYSFGGTETVVDTETLAYRILDRLPEIKGKLIKDAQAIYEGDPAASSPEEVILSYPGFYAISVYRIAHIFYTERVPYIPRLMTEHAHRLTGVDIHAGATVGEYFFIDHGTGIVIGETTVIGDRVKIYQGVTLGAKSFELGEDGNPVKGIKRHPNIGNDCVIYAGATILGGSTYVGDGSVIGGNVWLTRSVPAGSTVIYDGATFIKNKS